MSYNINRNHLKFDSKRATNIANQDFVKRNPLCYREVPLDHLMILQVTGSKRRYNFFYKTIFQELNNYAILRRSKL